MKYKKQAVCLALMLGLLALAPVQAQAVDYVQSPPLSQVVKTPVQDCRKFDELPVPMIAWGGDMATIYANGNTEKTAQGSIFAKKGISARLYRKDRFVDQVTDYVSCKTPFLRGTLGMLLMANDVINADPRTQPVYIYKLTDSEGGDALVVRDSIKSPQDIKKVSMQAYGPHVEYFVTLKSLGVDLNKVEVKWVRDITEDAKDKTSTFPAKALREDKSVEAAFVISPDADALTSGSGKVGTGAEDSVKGARVIMSSTTCNTCIVDVYVVRKDFYDANQQMVFNFVHGLMLAQEASANLMVNKTTQKQAYSDWIKASGKMMLDNADGVADTEGLWSGAHFAGWKGNVKFFTDDNYPRNFAKISLEVGTAFGAGGLKLISKPANLAAGYMVGLDYAKLSDGIQDKGGVEAPRFNKQAVEQIVRQRQQQDKISEGTLFSFEIYFQPNQQSFSADQYSAEFEKVIGLASTYGGALLTVEGHADTLAYLKRKADPSATPMELSRMKQGAKNLTLQRANMVRQAVLDYAKSKGNNSLDPNQFSPVGYGFEKPNVPGCVFGPDGDVTAKCAPHTKEEWDAMRRVVFRVVSVEAEMSQFEALDTPSAKK